MALTASFEDALVYAARLHAGQVRPGTSIPYVSHLLAVTSLVLEAGGDEDQTIAALLHDAAEDHGGRARLEDIRRRFGDRVARIVEGCTDSLDEPRPPWRQRKERYFEHLRTAPPDVLLVSLADKLHNARSVLADYSDHGSRLWQRFEGGPDYLRWYEASLAELFTQRLPGRMASELSQAVADAIALSAPGERTPGDSANRP